MTTTRLSRLSTKALTRKLGIREVDLLIVDGKREAILKALSIRSSCNCLEPLNGMAGVSSPRPIKDISQLIPHPVAKEIFFVIRGRFEEGHEMTDVTFNLNSGLVRFKKRGKGTEVKVGKYLKNLNKYLLKSGGCPDYIRVGQWALNEWEIRELDWKWEISTKVSDIYTMSTYRPWTSCLRLSLNAINVLNEYAALGAALLFFKRNNHICGRVLIEPWITRRDNPVISIGYLHGSGPNDGRVAVITKKAMARVFRGIRTVNDTPIGWCNPYTYNLSEIAPKIKRAFDERLL